jgi:mannosyltransferase OCH1-like enzyme
MKKVTFLLIAVVLISLGFFVVWRLSEIGLLYYNLPSLSSLDLLKSDIYIWNNVSLSFYTEPDPSVPHSIPRVIHQTWKSSNLSEYPGYNSHELWKYRYEHRGYQIRLWTDEDIEELIVTRYPDLHQYYHQFPYGIQRADVARYLILYHEGGFYCDLDVFPNALFINHFKSFHLIIPFSTDSHTLSNHFLGASKGSPFMLYLITSLKEQSSSPSDSVFPTSFPYFNVLASTGPFYLHRKFYEYFTIHMSSSSSASSGRTLLLYQQVSNRFFYHIGGRSWLLLDGIIFNFIGDYIFTIIIVLVCLCVVCLLYFGLMYRYFRFSFKSFVVNSTISVSEHPDIENLKSV